MHSVPIVIYRVSHLNAQCIQAMKKKGTNISKLNEFEFFFLSTSSLYHPTWERDCYNSVSRFTANTHAACICTRKGLHFINEYINLHLHSLCLSLSIYVKKKSACFVRTILQFFRRRRCMYMSGFFLPAYYLHPHSFSMLAFVSIVWPYCASTVWC